MNKIKLVIEMPEPDYLWIKNHVMTVNEQIIASGKLLDEVLEKIRAEIEEAKDKIFCTDGERQGLSIALDIIDSYRGDADEMS